MGGSPRGLSQGEQTLSPPCGLALPWLYQARGPALHPTAWVPLYVLCCCSGARGLAGPWSCPRSLQPAHPLEPALDQEFLCVLVFVYTCVSVCVHLRGYRHVCKCVCLCMQGQCEITHTNTLSQPWQGPQLLLTGERARGLGGVGDSGWAGAQKKPSRFFSCCCFHLAML